MLILSLSLPVEAMPSRRSLQENRNVISMQVQKRLHWGREKLYRLVLNGIFYKKMLVTCMIGLSLISVYEIIGRPIDPSIESHVGLTFFVQRKVAQ